MSFHCGNVFLQIRATTNVFPLELFFVLACGQSIVKAKCKNVLKIPVVNSV